MPEITTLKGDIVLEAEQGAEPYDVVLQNNNCMNRMGAGVALRIAQSWPEVEFADQQTQAGDANKLGKYSSATVERNGRRFTVFNLYGQYRYGPRHERHFDINAFNEAVTSLKAHLSSQYPGRSLRILFPLMGTGHGGGRWRHVRDVLLTHLNEHQLFLITLH